MKWIKLKYKNKDYTSEKEIIEILESEKLFDFIEADMENVVFEIKNGVIIFEGGNFIYGDWKFGIFKDGIFQGKWFNGIWEGGIFKGHWLDDVNHKPN